MIIKQDRENFQMLNFLDKFMICLLYTSDAADD